MSKITRITLLPIFVVLWVPTFLLIANRDAALSQTIAGAIVHHASENAGFLFLALVAAAAFMILWLLMPETLGWKQSATEGTLVAPPKRTAT